MSRYDVIDPRMYDVLPQFMPQTVDIIDPNAQDDDPWGNPEDRDEVIYENLDCNVAPSGGDEVRDDDTVYGYKTHTIMIPGLYHVKSGWTARVDNHHEYRVLLAEKDSQRSQTRLQTEWRGI